MTFRSDKKKKRWKKIMSEKDQSRVTAQGRTDKTMIKTRLLLIKY